MIVEVHGIGRVGKCAARYCNAGEVLVITAGDSRLVLCERCFYEMINGACIAMGADISRVHLRLRELRNIKTP